MNAIKIRETQTRRGEVSGFLWSAEFHFPDAEDIGFITRHERELKAALEEAMNRYIREIEGGVSDGHKIDELIDMIEHHPAQLTSVCIRKLPVDGVWFEKEPLMKTLREGLGRFRTYVKLAEYCLKNYVTVVKTGDILIEGVDEFEELIHQIKE